MSADNFYVISQHPVYKRWCVAMGFASDEGDLTWQDFWHENAIHFDNEDDAIEHAQEEYSEYGVSTIPWPVERKPCHCPVCGIDWSEGQSIPVESLGHYGGEHGVPMDCEHGCGRPRHYEGKVMGQYSRERDITVAYSCMGCGTSWPRGTFYASRVELNGETPRS